MLFVFIKIRHAIVKNWRSTERYKEGKIRLKKAYGKQNLHCEMLILNSVSFTYKKVDFL